MILEVPCYLSPCSYNSPSRFGYRRHSNSLTMVKFSSGTWTVGPHISVNWATEVVKSEAFEDRIRCVVSMKPINHRGDTLNTPTITIECSSPIPDTFFLEACHWKSQQLTSTGPNYEVFPDVDIGKLSADRQDGLETSKTESELKIATKTLSAVFDTRPGILTLTSGLIMSRIRRVSHPYLTTSSLNLAGDLWDMSSTIQTWTTPISI